jgi:LEA14-like dessication related protein
MSETRLTRIGTVLVPICVASLISCVSLPNRDPLTVNVAGIATLPGEGLELRLLVSVRVINPNDTPVDYSGAALDFYLNDRRLATGVSGASGSVPRYGESVLAIPVTISAFDVARQLLGFATGRNTDRFNYRVRGKLDGGLLGTRRFEDEGEIRLDIPVE